MANRYSRITESARLRPALDRYVTYLSGAATRPSRVGTRGAAAERDEVAVLPFTFALTTGQKVIVTVAKESLTFLSSQINATADANVDTAPEAVTNPLYIPGFKAARVVFFHNTVRTVSTPTSDVTGLEYLKYNGDRYSCVFGAKTANNDERDAFLLIKRRLQQQHQTSKIKRVSLIPEKSQYR